jgi:hypothetical protein
MRTRQPEICVRFSPAKVTKVAFTAAHTLDRELLDEVWVSTIGPVIEHLDRELRRSMQAVALELERQDREIVDVT